MDMGFCVVGTAANGVDALRLVQTIILGTLVKAGMNFGGWYLNGTRVTKWSKVPAKKGDTLSSGRLKYTITGTVSGKRTVKVTAPVKKTYSSMTVQVS